MDNVLSLIVYADTRALAASHANRSPQFCIVISVFMISSNYEIVVRLKMQANFYNITTYKLSISLCG